MITEVHGGPAWASQPHFIGQGFAAKLLDAGYAVFLPNPRGSFGQGEAFTKANVKDFGYGDLRDILTGITAVEKAAPIDDKRLGLTGWSYGGFMTMWAVTQTNRFHAAVAGAGIANWQSYYGENGIDEWMIPYFGGVRLRGSRRVCKILADQLHSQRAHADTRGGGRERYRMPGAANPRILARAGGSVRTNAIGDLSG